MSTPTTEVREQGPYRVISNGRTIRSFAGRVLAERHAARIRGAIVQGRTVTVLSGLGDGR